MSLREALSAGPIVLDGATGTELMARGLPSGTPPALWTIERPDEVRRLAAEYAEAGARVLLTNTFAAAPAFLTGSGCDTSEIIDRAVAIAREAAGARAYVAASVSAATRDGLGGVGVSGEFLMQFERLAALGVDAIVVETMSRIDDVRQAVAAANAVRGDTPLVVCMTFGADLRALDGTLPEELAWVLEDFGADAVGVNCCDGPETALRVVEAMARATDLPIWAKPNAGLPSSPVTDAEFVATAERIASAGARAIGGCCGTTPATIRMLAGALFGRI